PPAPGTGGPYSDCGHSAGDHRPERGPHLCHGARAACGLGVPRGIAEQVPGVPQNLCRSDRGRSSVRPHNVHPEVKIAVRESLSIFAKLFMEARQIWKWMALSCLLCVIIITCAVISPKLMGDVTNI